MDYKDIIGKVSKELDIPIEVVDKAYKSSWKFIKDNVQSLPLKEDISEEDFNELRTSFNLPSLGKLNTTWDRVVGAKKRFEYLKSLNK
jgi:hypothetical protein